MDKTETKILVMMMPFLFLLFYTVLNEYQCSLQKTNYCPNILSGDILHAGHSEILNHYTDCTAVDVYDDVQRFLKYKQSPHLERTNWY